MSWSGERSKALAEAVHDWLPNVIQAVEPWMSANDVDKGTRWRAGLANELEQATVSIICLTPENLNAPWLNFEAGALSKQTTSSLVCTLLLGLDPIDVREPLAQFQATKAEKDDLRKLVHTINRQLGDSALPEPKIIEAFDVWWPKFDEPLSVISSLPRTNVNLHETNAAPVEYQRDTREILSEILELVREQSHERKDELAQVRESAIHGSTRRRLRLLANHLGVSQETIKTTYFRPQDLRRWQLEISEQAVKRAQEKNKTVPDDDASNSCEVST
jgi:hypothetical protein